jgi:hypothetical protein
MNTGLNTPIKETGFSKSMGELNNQIDQLLDRVNCLGNRLELFLNQQQPCNPSGAEKPMSKPRAITEIDSCSTKVVGIRSIVDDLIARLEL